MSIEDAIIGGGRDFDPRRATEDLIRDVAGDIPPGSPIDVRALNTRLARKLGQKPPKVEEPDTPDAGPLDFSSQAAPPAPADVTDTSLDFSTQAAPPELIGPVPPPATTSLSDYPAEAAKRFASESKGFVAGALKGTAAAGIPTTADASLLERLPQAKAMTPADRAKLMGDAIRGISDRGLQMDYQASLRRIANGADPAAEVAQLGPKFEANNKKATGPITDDPLYKAGQAVENYGKDALAPKPGFEPGKSLTMDVIGGAGSMLTGMAVGLIPGIGPATSGALFTASGMGEAAENAVHGKATTQQVREAARWGGVAGATDMADNLLPMLGSTGKALGLVKRVGIAAVKGALIEGGQEGLQQAIQNWIEQGIYNPKKDLTDDVPRSMLVAAILGGMAGGGSGALHRNEKDSPAPAAGDGGSGAAPGGVGGNPPPGSGPGSTSSPEDIADFVRRAKESAPDTGQGPDTSGPSGIDPSKMTEAEWINAYAASRDSHGNASDAEILKAAGMAPDEIAGLSEDARIDAVIRATKAAPEGTAEAKPEAERPQESADADYSTLRAYGYSDEDIEAMPERQRRREAMDAVAEGVDQAEAAKKYPRPATAEAAGNVAGGPAANDSSSAQTPSSVGGTDPDKTANGTRKAPITATTAADVTRALPAAPTEAQAEAENYKHAHIEMPQLGLTGKNGISIETGVGQDRKGVGADGKPWSVKMENAAYGRIKGTVGADGDHLDVFVGPHPTSPHVFVVDQHEPGGAFDEHKIMAGFRTPIDALHAYANAYSDGGKDRVGHVTAMGPEEFKAWLQTDTSKPLKPAVAPTPESAGAEAESLAAPESQAESPAATRSTAPKSKGSDVPLSLLQFLASKGGLKPHGDLTGMDAHRHRVQIPGRKGFFGLVKSDGMPLDMAREAAEEAGYLRGEDANKTSTERDLLDAIDQEMRGERVSAEGEEGYQPKNAQQREEERQAADRENEIAAARRDIDAEYPGSPSELLDAAAQIMFDEQLDIDSAVEQAAMRAVDEDADYQISHDSIADTFGEGVFDAIQPKPAPENGRRVEPERAEKRRSQEGEEASGDGERVPDTGAQEPQGADEEVGTPLAINKFLDHVDQEIARGHMNVEIAPTTSMKDFRAVAESRGWLQAPYGKGTALWSPDRTHAVFYNAPVEGNHLNVQWVTPGEGVTPPTDKTEAGEQTVIPGAEKIGQGEQAQRAADRGLKPKAPQKPADDGLFGDAMDQRDLMDVVERKLGADAQFVAPVDIARAAEIMEANPGMPPETAFGQAVVENAVEQGFITEQEAIDAYGEEVTDLLEAGREGASGSSGDVEQASAATNEVGAGDAAEAGVIPSGGETGEAISASESDRGTVAAKPDTTEQQAADGNEGADQPAAQDPNDAIGTNVNGDTLYQDARGVRSYSKGGVRVSETVGMRPKRGGGMEMSINSEARGPEFLLPEENDRKAERDAPKWAEITHALPLDAAGHKDMELAARLMFEISGIRQPSFNDLTPSQKVELLARLKPQEKTNGVSQAVPDGNAAAGAEVVPPVESGQRAGSVRGAESPRGESNAAGSSERGTAAADGSEPAGSRGTDASSDVPVSERGEPKAGRETRADERRAADSVVGENYHIEPGSLGESRGPKAKAEGNLAAIKLANRLVADGMPATLAEQHQLAEYVGWGGIKGAFRDADGNFAKGFEKLGDELHDNLTPEEYDTARRSIQYAHYTAEKVINAMWRAADRLGFKGGAVFEPGMGVGHFAGLMPADVAARSSYSGVEMDHVTARIAKLLYPQWGVRREDFTKMPLGENSFDIAIGNPPFADIAIKSDPKYAQHGFLLHDYFFAKSLDAVRPGGLLMFVTSAGTMNKLDPSARQYLADRADLVGAIRLPGNAFKENAGTEVTTDIVVLRKLMPGEEFGDRSWTQTAEVTLPGPDGKPVKGQISRYFAEHPEMVLGEGDFADKLYEGRYSVKAPKGFDLTAALAKAVDSLPENVMRDAETPTQRAEMDFETAEKKDGSYYVKDGKLMQQRDGAGYAVEQRGKGVEGGKSAAEMERIRGLIPIRDALRNAFAADLADDVAGGSAARVNLNNAYDAFVEKFGPINKAEISRRRPNSIQQESARSEAREEARYSDQRFDEGSFDASAMIDRGASLSEIARARAVAREQQGEAYSEGSFDPEEMADIIIDKRPNIAPFADDQENYRLRAIEKYDETTGRATKGPAFLKNIITKDAPPQINSVNDATLYVLNQTGRLDIDRIAAMIEKSPTEVIEGLGDSIYQVPGTQDAWETREKYLSGNVRKKLAIAQEAARRDPKLRRNVDALEAAQPAPLAPSQIGASLGMPWIPSDVVEQFGTEALGLDKLKATYSPAIASWSVSGDTGSVAAVSTWGTNRRNATALLTDVLNRQSPKIYDQIDKDTRVLNTVATQAAQEKMQALRDKFDEWVFSDEKRADRLASYYNDNYNNLVVQEFDGAYLTTPGIADGWSWRPHQKRVIARIIQTGNTYMAHAVGAGKTSGMIGAGMEMRRLGLVKKPMYAVPNHMLGQFTKEFYEQYPTARIMVADDRQFHTDRRKQFMANVAVSDIDAVIITHSSFGMIPVSDEFKDQIIQQQVAEYRAALATVPAGSEARITRSRIEKQIERLTQRLSGKSNRKSDKVFTFDEMGVDFLFVDEAHEFRKLDFTTQMSNLKGIDPEGAGKSYDMYLKTLLLEQRNPGRNLVMASGTPVTNTMAELYTLSRYMQMQELEERGLKQFDAWAGAFGENVTELEQDASGGYKPVSRFAKFVNVAELSAMVRQVMDVVTSRQLEQYVVRPKIKGGKRKLHLAEQSEELVAYNASLAARMKAMEGRGKPKPGDDIMLTVIQDGRHAAIDMRLAGGTRTETPSKIDVMIDNMFATWKATKAQKFYKPKNGAYDMSNPVAVGPATQMAFINLGISGSRGLPTQDYVRSELVRRGVPRAEIAIISDYKNHVAKQKLFNDMNEGKVRILIGSVAKMGTGVNAQRRLYSVHNLDPLWYPSDDEQRNGRALRQGNWNPEIEINDYAAKGTYDSTMWGMMEKKARFIQGFFEGDPSLRSMEDLGEASQYEQAKALTTNDPRLMRLTEMRQELEKANRRKSAFDNDRYAIRQRRAQEKSTLEYYEGRVTDIQKDIAQRVPLAGEDFKAKIGREVFDKRVDFAEALIQRMEQVSTPANSGKHITIGEISGFSLVATPQKMADEMHVSMDLMRNGGAQTHVNGQGMGAIRSIESTIGGFDIELKSAQQRIDTARKFLKDSESDAQKTFTGGAEMESLGTEIKQLQAELSAKKDEPKAPTSTDGALPDYTVSAQQQAPEIENLLRSIIRHLVGDHVGVDFSPGAMEIAQPKGWGKIKSAGARGLYFPTHHWIRLALINDVDSTAFHEAYHAIEYQLQTPEERAMMERETPRMREYVGRKRSAYSKEQLDSIAPEEIRAIAFEEYAKERSSGSADAGKGLHVAVRRWFSRLVEALERLRNGLRGMGFTTYRDVFAKAYRGDYSRASGATPRAEAVMGDPLASMHHEITSKLNDAWGERLTALRVKVQDKFLRVRNAEEAADPNLPTRLSTYQADSLYPGRTGQRLEQIDREEFQPLIRDMKDRGVSLKEAGDYLTAVHAFERNAEMDRINHGKLFEAGKDLTGRGSGMSDAEAQAIIDKITDDGRIADFEAIGGRVRKIIDDTRDRLVSYGLISQDTADAWQKKYANYVPLRGFEEGTEDDAMPGRGQGFDTRAKETKQAFGRLSRSANPLTYVMTQAEMSIVRGEKNKVGNTFLRFVQSYPAPAQWTVDTPKVVKSIDKRTGLVTTIQDPSWRNDPNLFVTKVGGVPKLIRLEGTEGANLARALKNTGTEQLGTILQHMRMLTTTLARLSTQWNPNFILPNLTRDLGEALINMREDQIKGIAGQFTKHLIPSMRGSFRGIRDSAKTDKYSDYFREYDQAGGRIHFFGLSNPVDVEKSMADKMRQLEGGTINNAREVAGKLAEGFDAINGALENATRLAYYITLRENGVSAADAAMKARNLTVDFNKGGEFRGPLNALFMFSNVGLQGSRRMVKALGSKHVRRAVYALMALSALAALSNYGSSGDDDAGDNNYEKVPEWDRDKNLIIMWPKGMGHDGQYIKIPLPFGFSMFKVAADRMVGVALGHEKIGAAAGTIFKSVIDAFNPLGEEGVGLFSVLPTLLRMPFHIATNKNWNGRDLYPDSQYLKNKPDSEKAFNTTPEYAKAAARALNTASGGSPYKSGAVDVHPGSIQHVFETMTGGLGKFISNVADTVGDAAKGTFDATRAPIVRRFTGSVNTEQADTAAYYKVREEAKKNGGDAIKQARKDRARGINRDEADSFLRENTNSVQAENVFKNADQQMKPLRERLDRVKNAEMPAAEKAAATKDITDRMRAVQNAARKRYRDLKERPAP